jgi:DNA-binding NarL/FixJ family response regulator
MPSKQTTVVIADQCEFIRQGVRALLQAAKLHVAGEAGNGIDAIKQIKRLKPDVAIVGHPMVSMNGLNVAHQVWDERLSTRLVLLMRGPTEAAIEKAYTLRVNGIVLQSDPSADIVKAVLAAADNHPWATGWVKEWLTSHAHPPRERVGFQANQHYGLPLTRVESTVLQLLAESGGAAKAVADKMGISENTVCNHRSKIMAKLGLHSVVELAVYAVKAGLVDVEVAV